MVYDRLILHHFKSIESAEVDLGQVTIIVGANGSGKSNIIDAIRFLRDAAFFGLDRAVSDRHGIESVRQWSPTRPFRLTMEIRLRGENKRSSYDFAIDSKSGQFTVAKETAYLEEIDEMHAQDEDGNSVDLINFSRTIITRNVKGEVCISRYTKDIEDDERDLEVLSRSNDQTKHDDYRFIIDKDELSLSRPAPGMYELRRDLTQFQAYSIYPNTLRTPQEPSNETYLAPEGRNLASVFKRMRKTRRGQSAIEQITIAMRSILPNLERISILNVGGFLVPQFHILEPTNRRHVFNVSQMSDGTLRVFGLLTALYQEPRPSVIALEEPEQTVNPGILAILAESIKEVSERTQVLVTTHSPNFLDFFDPDQVIAVEMIDGKTKIGKVDASQIRAVRNRLFSLGELLITEGIFS